MQKTPQKQFINCSSKNYERNKYCPVYGLECFDCHKKGHFRGVKASEQGRKYTHRVESESDTSNSEYGATDSDNDSHQDKQTLNRTKYSRRNHIQHITKVNRT